ncbi:MAG: nitroreductase family protein [Erysipelotrichaceae bacterium]|nr:nitroreductase family protein [Erysipelotrichaceae bacterium]
METLDAIALRKSTRDFDSSKPVAKEIVDTVVKAGCQAAIAGKPGESLHLTVCTNRDILLEISQFTAKAMNIEGGRDFFYGAPVVIFVSAAPEQMMPGIEIPNTACVIENMLIAATDAGLENIYLWGAVQATAKNKELCDKLGIPEGFKPVSAAAIGYSKSGTPEPRELKFSLGVNYVD